MTVQIEYTAKILQDVRERFTVCKDGKASGHGVSQEKVWVKRQWPSDSILYPIIEIRKYHDE